MRVVKYNLHIPPAESDDPERAVLPTIIYAKRGVPGISIQILAIGWWAWGIGIKRTVIDLEVSDGKK